MSTEETVQNVDPTAKYAIDQFRELLGNGAEITSDAVQLLSAEVANMGIAYCIYGLGLTILSIMLAYVCRRSWSYAEKIGDDGWIGISFVSGVAAVVSFIGTLICVPAGLKMWTAPTYYLINNLI